MTNQPSKLPRGDCPVCGRRIAVHPDGSLYDHRINEKLPPKRSYRCQGSGAPPLGPWPLPETAAMSSSDGLGR